MSPNLYPPQLFCRIFLLVLILIKFRPKFYQFERKASCDMLTAAVVVVVVFSALTSELVYDLPNNFAYFSLLAGFLSLHVAFLPCLIIHAKKAFE